MVQTAEDMLGFSPEEDALSWDSVAQAERGSAAAVAEGKRSTAQSGLDTMQDPLYAPHLLGKQQYENPAAVAEVQKMYESEGLATRESSSKWDVFRKGVATSVTLSEGLAIEAMTSIENFGIDHEYATRLADIMSSHLEFGDSEYDDGWVRLHSPQRKYGEDWNLLDEEGKTQRVREFKQRQTDEYFGDVYSHDQEVAHFGGVVVGTMADPSIAAPLSLGGPGAGMATRYGHVAASSAAYGAVESTIHTLALDNRYDPEQAFYAAMIAGTLGPAIQFGIDSFVAKYAAKKVKAGQAANSDELWEEVVEEGARAKSAREAFEANIVAEYDEKFLLTLQERIALEGPSPQTGLLGADTPLLPAPGNTGVDVPGGSRPMRVDKSGRVTEESAIQNTLRYLVEKEARLKNVDPKVYTDAINKAFTIGTSTEADRFLADLIQTEMGIGKRNVEDAAVEERFTGALSADKQVEILDSVGFNRLGEEEQNMVRNALDTLNLADQYIRTLGYPKKFDIDAKAAALVQGEDVPTRVADDLPAKKTEVETSTLPGRGTPMGQRLVRGRSSRFDKRGTRGAMEPNKWYPDTKTKEQAIYLDNDTAFNIRHRGNEWVLEELVESGYHFPDTVLVDTFPTLKSAKESVTAPKKPSLAKPTALQNKLNKLSGKGITLKGKTASIDDVETYVAKTKSMYSGEEVPKKDIGAIIEAKQLASKTPEQRLAEFEYSLGEGKTGLSLGSAKIKKQKLKDAADAEKKEAVLKPQGVTTYKRVNNRSGRMDKDYGVAKGGTEVTYPDGNKILVWKEEGGSDEFMVSFMSDTKVPDYPTTKFTAKDAVDYVKSYDSYEAITKQSNDFDAQRNAASIEGGRQARIRSMTPEKDIVPPAKKAAKDEPKVVTKQTDGTTTVTNEKGDSLVTDYHVTGSLGHVGILNDVVRLAGKKQVGKAISNGDDSILTVHVENMIDDSISLKDGLALIEHIADNESDWMTALKLVFMGKNPEKVLPYNPIHKANIKTTAVNSVVDEKQANLKTAKDVLNNQQGFVARELLNNIFGAAVGYTAGMAMTGDTETAMLMAIAGAGVPYLAGSIGRKLVGRAGRISERRAAEEAGGKVSDGFINDITLAYNKHRWVGRPHMYLESLGESGRIMSKLWEDVDIRQRQAKAKSLWQVKDAMRGNGLKLGGPDEDIVKNILKHIPNKPGEVTNQHISAAAFIRDSYQQVIRKAKNARVISNDLYEELTANALDKGWMPRVWDTDKLTSFEGSNQFRKMLVEKGVFNNRLAAEKAVESLTGANKATVASIVDKMNKDAGKYSINPKLASIIFTKLRESDVTRSKYLERQRRIPEQFEEGIKDFLVDDLQAASFAYFSDAHARIESAATFGPNDELVSDLVNRIGKEFNDNDMMARVWEIHYLAAGQPHSANNYIKTMVEMPPLSRAMLKGIHTWASYKLVLAQIPNAFQPLVTGPTRLVSTGMRPDRAFMTAIGKTLKAYSSSEAREIADRAGAGMENAALQILGEATSKSRYQLGKDEGMGIFSIFSDPYSFLKATGFIGVDYANRVASYHMGVAQVEHLLEGKKVLLDKQAGNNLSKAENKKLDSINKDLRALGIDFKVDPTKVLASDVEQGAQMFSQIVNSLEAPKSVEHGALKFSHDTQFINTPLQKPLVLNSPYASIFFKFKNYMLHHMHFVNVNLTQKLTKDKDPKKFATMLATVLAAGSWGMAVNKIRDTILATDDEDFTWTRKAIEGQLVTGHVGLLMEGMHQAVRHPRGFEGFLEGPILKDGKELLEAGYRSYEQGDPAVLGKKVARSFGPSKLVLRNAERANQAFDLGLDIPDLWEDKEAKTGRGRGGRGR